MSYRGDERFQHHADWGIIREAKRFARACHENGFPLEGIAELRGVEVERQPLPVGRLGGLCVSRTTIWGAVLDDRLNRRETTTILSHELGHTHIVGTDARGRFIAHCRARMRSGRDRVEEMANVIGALYAVPFGAVERLALDDDARSLFLAERIGVATTFIYLRNALAIVLGEKSGSRSDAFNVMDLALMEHEHWLHDVSARIETQAVAAS